MTPQDNFEPLRPKQQYCLWKKRTFSHYNHQRSKISFCCWIFGSGPLLRVSITFFFYNYVLISSHFLFSGTYFKQGISRDKSSEVASEGCTNDSIPSKDPEGGGLLLPEPSLSNTFSFPVLNCCLDDFVLKAVCYLHA